MAGQSRAEQSTKAGGYYDVVVVVPDWLAKTRTAGQD